MVKYLVYLIVAVCAVVLLLISVDHYMLKPARAQGHEAGVQETTAKLLPQITSLSEQLTEALNANSTLDAKITGLQQDYDAYKAATVTAQARYDAAEAAAAQRAASSEQALKALRAQLARKPQTPTAVQEVIAQCNRADGILSDIIRKETAQ